MENSELKTLWNEREDKKLGTLLDRLVLDRDKPGWFSCLLKLLMPVDDSIQQDVEQLLAIVEDSTRWHEAHISFDSFRGRTLSLEKAEKAVQLSLGTLYLAENVAKTTYNCSLSNDEVGSYDQDTVTWIPGCVRFIVDNMSDEETRLKLINYLLTPKAVS